MAKVRPTYVVMTNFRSFAGKPVRIDLPATGLVSIEGPSGSGKSNIVKALAFALGYEPTAATRLRTWLNDEPWGVQVGLDIDGKTGSRLLGSKTLLRVEGDPDVTTATAASEKMQALLGGLEPDTLRAMTYRQQQRPGAFLSQPDSKKRAFLVKVVPALGKFDVEYDASCKTTAGIERQRSEIAAMRDAYAGALGEHPGEPEDTTSLEADLEAVSTKLATIQSRMTTLARLLENQLEDEALASTLATADLEKKAVQLEAELKALPPVPLPSDHQALTEARLALVRCRTSLRDEGAANDFLRGRVNEERADLYGRIELCKEDGRKADAAEHELEGMVHDLAHLSGNKCPRCGQQWQAAKEEADQLEKVFIPGMKLAIERYRKLAANVSALEKELETKVHVTSPKLLNLVELEAELVTKVAVEEGQRASATKILEAERNAKVSSMKNAIAQLRAEERSMGDAAKQNPANPSRVMATDLEVLRGAFQEKEREQTGLKVELAVTKETNRALVTRQQEWQSRQGMLTAAERKLTEIENKLAAEKDYGDLIKSFVGAAFEGVLDEVAQEANEALIRVENTQAVSIKFDTEKTNNEGEVASKIIPVVSIRGHEATPADLSGGMGTMVDLAVDLLGMGEVAARRTGFDPGWLILDESFDGMGTNDREGCMSILRQYADKKLIMVVTHSAEFKEMFSKRIRVGITSNGSSFLEED